MNPETNNIHAVTIIEFRPQVQNSAGFKVLFLTATLAHPMWASAVTKSPTIYDACPLPSNACQNQKNPSHLGDFRRVFRQILQNLSRGSAYHDGLTHAHNAHMLLPLNDKVVKKCHKC